MRTFFFKNSSLTRKLMLAFIITAVLPMFIASKVATDLVNNTINVNLERWLRNTARYFFESLDESKDELQAVHTLLDTRFTKKEIRFSREELDAFSNLDADIIMLSAENGDLLFVSPEIRSIDTQPLFPGATLKWVTMQNGSRELAIVVERTLKAWDGSLRSLKLANLLSIQLSDTGTDEPVSIHIFLPGDNGFVHAYASSPLPLPAIPVKALESALSVDKEIFIPDKDWTDNTPNAHLLLHGIRDEQGNALAVVVISAHMLPLEAWMPTSRQLFWVFFIAGTLFSGCIGYVLARRIVKPITMLNEGVENIAAGNLGHRIAVHGNDELAALSSGFNLMGRQLEAMRREGAESARQERSRMLGEIALGFAHEIRNPLVVIKTSAELVHAKLPTDGKESRLMGFVVEEVGRIDSLVREFLAFANPAPITFELFSLQKLVKDALEISAAEFAKRNIRYALVIDAEDSSVLGEHNQLHQVLLNLFLNAIDAMPEGGDLTVRVYESEDKTRIRMDVTDTGIGIPDDVLPTIFQPFTSTKKNGLGLGLAKTRAIVEAHSGNISCSSVPGQGTTITICLNRCS